MAIGHRIKKAREDAGLTQRELAKAVGVSHGMVGQWENHTKKPGRESLRKIAEAALVDAAFLISDKPLAEHGVRVTDRRALDMLRRWNRLSRRQQDNLLELFAISGDVRREIEKKRQPSES